jgi:peptide/nickel transport system substrate-binding protein
MVDWATWLSEVYLNRKYQATIISLDGVNVSPRSFLSRYLSDAGDNFVNFNNPEYDQVFNAAMIEPNEERRIALYRESQRIVSEYAASVFIQDIVGFRAFSRGSFDGMVNYPLYIIDFSPMYRR